MFDIEPFQSSKIKVENNDIKDFENTINVKKGDNVHVKITEFETLTNISYMFEETSLFSIPDNYIWNISKVIDMGNLSLNCSLLESIPAVEYWNTSNAKSMDNLFKGCNH